MDNAIDSCRCRDSAQDPPAVRVMLTRSPVGATRSKDSRGDELGGEHGFGTTENNAAP